MADECCRCVSWNRETHVCKDKESPFFGKKTEDYTACDCFDPCDHKWKIYGKPEHGKEGLTIEVRVKCTKCGVSGREIWEFSGVVVD